MSDQKPVSSFGAMLRAALGEVVSSRAGTGFLAMCSEDIVFQLPYAPAGLVREVRGKAQLAAYIQKVGELIAFDVMSMPVTHASVDGETFVLEFSCKGHGMLSGGDYDQDYISVIRVRGGEIVQYRDYWNPLILLGAVGGSAPLVAHFQEFTND